MAPAKLTRDRSDMLDELRSRFMYQEKIRERIRGQVKEYTCEYENFEPTFEALRLTPYWDPDYNLITEITEDGQHVDYDLDEYIHRLCTRSIMDVASGRAINDTSEDIFPELNDSGWYRSNIAHAHDPYSEYERSLRKLGRKDKKKKEDKERGDNYADPKTNIPECVAVHSHKNTPLITMTLRQLRKCIFMECQHKLKRAYFQYESQFHDHENERLGLIRTVIRVREQLGDMLKEQERTEDYIRRFKETCHSLESKVEISKEAKRRRRQAKRRRVRSEQAECVGSKSETRSEDQNGGRPADKKLEGSLSD